MADTKPRVVALLPWWDENPSWLYQCVRSLAGFADHVVAGDGPYELLRSDHTESDPAQRAAIIRATRAGGMGCTIVPGREWRGGQVEKMNELIAAAQNVGAGWLLKICADERLDGDRQRARAILATTDVDVAAVEAKVGPARRIFRASVGVKAECAVQFSAVDGEQLASRPANATPRAFSRLVPAITVPLSVESIGVRPLEVRARRNEASRLAELFSMYPATIEHPAETRPMGQPLGCAFDGRKCEARGCGGDGHWTTCPLGRWEIERQVREVPRPGVVKR